MRYSASTRTGNADLDARIASYELAYGMQTTASEAVEIDKETEHTGKLYGTDNPATEDFGKRCLLAHRLVERGVRFIQVYSTRIDALEIPFRRANAERRLA